jgi:hypothetical protein
VASNNVFQFITVGISDKGGDFASSSITGNQFYNNEKGFELRHGNSTPSNPALFQIKCNDFVKDQNTAGTQTYGIYLSHGARLNPQGSCPNNPLFLSSMSNNEFLSDGYPLQYINNGTQSVFAAGYDWFNDFYGIANVNSTALAYRAAANENLGPGSSVQNTGVNVIICPDPVTSSPAFSVTATCPTFFGAANRSIPASSILPSEVSVFPNPNQGMFNLRCISCGVIEAIGIYNTLGEEIAKFSYGDKKTEQIIDLNSTDIQSGVYSIKIIGLNHTERTSFVLRR